MTIEPLPSVRDTFIRDVVLDWSQIHPAGRTGMSDDEVD